MGCLFGCFRLKGDDQRKAHIFSSSTPSMSTEKLPSKNQLASVFLREEEVSPHEQVRHKDNVDKDSSLERQLKHEAKFLKSCGALLETPAEIRKASERVIQQIPDQDCMLPQFDSWLSGTAGRKLLWDEQHGQLPKTPQTHEDSGFSEKSPEVFTSEGHNTLRHFENIMPSVSPIKSLRSEGVKHEAGVKSGKGAVTDMSPSRKESQFSPFASKCSPFPTPLKLTDEMQTPATVYPSNLEKFRTEKSTRIRTQYVNSVLNPVENISQWKLLSEGCSHPGESHDQFEQRNGDSPDTKKKTEQALLTSDPKNSKLTSSSRPTMLNEKTSQNDGVIYKDKYVCGESSFSLATPLHSKEKVPFRSDSSQIVVTSLSQWLRPPTTNNKGGNEIMTKERSHSGKSSDGDRPILGMVAAHWNEEEPDRISPKTWDGNGIPNSTNKYKEDQKVSWHATPFEERLEKALSDENFLPQRKCLKGKPVRFENEGEESDTAAS
ncbi:protein JASON isoform X2 [Elaeis guineensis]|uniref:Protein JASON isoform X2 n=1 Tax=Elaeis guineensis var. tenera TaxID=51953 RepID=A0A6J0PGY5_ELAGV|nr:protein JASON isoform X2 [Elaeis guineensis]